MNEEQKALFPKADELWQALEALDQEHVLIATGDTRDYHHKCLIVEPSDQAPFFHIAVIDTDLREVARIGDKCGGFTEGTKRATRKDWLRHCVEHIYFRGVEVDEVIVAEMSMPPASWNHWVWPSHEMYMDEVILNLSPEQIVAKRKAEHQNQKSD